MPTFRPRFPRASPMFAGLILFGLGVARLNAQAPVSTAGTRVEWWHGLIAVGGYALLTTMDGGIKRFAADHRSDGSDAFSGAVRKMGQPEVFIPVAIGVLATGLVSGNTRVRGAGVRITGSLALTGAIVTVVKFAAGRSRPSRHGSDADDFNPFSGATSTPSGHAAMAFALATSLSDQFGKPWASAILFTAATGTAWSRVNDNVHWFSDVVAGAAIGIVTARFADGKLTLFGLSAPRLSPSTDGMSLTWKGQF
ncbi:MAG: phosphatase PAP2 family protein [Gemmatimonadota bacterium]